MQPSGQGEDGGGGMVPLCLDCARLGCDGTRGHRHVRHPELATLAVAHIDCDAFYASVEKRDRPQLASRPVIVGGGRRGVVTTACYIARIHGVRSAMPMFKALAACPDAVVIRPDFAKYSAVAAELRRMMLALTPLVQPLSIDEAALDLSGTASLHGAPPAVMLARLARRVEAELGITISVGLARNRLLAKLAAERGKPRGFTILGVEAAAVLAPEPVGLLPGIGAALSRRLAARGIHSIADLQALDDRTARARLGDDGPALAARARGEDARSVRTTRDTRSISAETTFETDLAELADLERPLWRMCEKLAGRLRDQHFAAGGITLKLKTASFASRTRAVRLASPTNLPDTLFEASRRLLTREATGARFRLIGLGASPLLPAEDADRPDLADPEMTRRVARQAALDALRSRYGADAVVRGRSLRE